MKHSNTTKCRHQWLTLSLCLAASPSLVLAEEENTLREFLSDPQRVGSLTGTIIGGALTAHPAGAAAGTLLGFFVGKQSMFETAEQKQTKQSRYAAASIVPISETSEEQQTLTFNDTTEPDITTLAAQQSMEPRMLDPQSPIEQRTLVSQSPSQAILLGAYIEDTPATQAQAIDTQTQEVTGLSFYDADTPLDDNEEYFTPEPIENTPPEQLAAHCYSGQRTNISAREHAMCYYYSG